MDHLPKELQIHIMEFMVPRMSQNSTLHDYNHIFNILKSCNCCDRHSQNKPSYIEHIMDYPPSDSNHVIRQ